jgi:hypothetical protein
MAIYLVISFLEVFASSTGHESWSADHSQTIISFKRETIIFILSNTLKLTI